MNRNFYLTQFYYMFLRRTDVMVACLHVSFLTIKQIYRQNAQVKLTLLFFIPKFSGKNNQ